MTDSPLTLIDDGRPVVVAAEIDGATAWLRADDMHAALGWELKPEGLCRGRVCVPVPAQIDLARGDRVNLAALARLLDRPLALDLDERAAYLGTAAAERAQQLASLYAPDFTLPDLSGRMHSLSDFRGRKVLLIAYASW